MASECREVGFAILVHGGHGFHIFAGARVVAIAPPRRARIIGSTPSMPVDSVELVTVVARLAERVRPIAAPRLVESRHHRADVDSWNSVRREREREAPG
jgi:hypothetical protein